MRAAALSALVAIASLSTAPSTASATESDAETMRPTAALHRGVVSGNAVTWRSVYAIGGCEKGETSIALALALPEQARTLVLSVTPHVRSSSDGRSLLVDCASLSGASTVAVTVVLPIDRSSTDLVLAPPLFQGDGVQAIAIDGEGEARFEPDTRGGFVRHVGFFSTDDIDDDARMRCDRMTGGDVRRSGTTYLRVTERVRDVGGLVGRLSTAPERARPATITLCIGFVVGLAGLALVHRRLSRTVALERAEETLRAEYDRLA